MHKALVGGENLVAPVKLGGGLRHFSELARNRFRCLSSMPTIGRYGQPLSIVATCYDITAQHSFKQMHLSGLPTGCFGAGSKSLAEAINRKMV